MCRSHFCWKWRSYLFKVLYHVLFITSPNLILFEWSCHALPAFKSESSDLGKFWFPTLYKTKIFVLTDDNYWWAAWVNSNWSPSVWGGSIWISYLFCSRLCPSLSISESSMFHFEATQHLNVSKMWLIADPELIFANCCLFRKKRTIGTKINQCCWTYLSFV